MAQLASDPRTRRVLAGACPDCGKPARKGRLLCAACAVRHNAAAKARARRPGSRSRAGEKCGACRRPGHDRRTCDLFGPGARSAPAMPAAVSAAQGAAAAALAAARAEALAAPRAEEKFLRAWPLPHDPGCFCVVCVRSRLAGDAGR